MAQRRTPQQKDPANYPRPNGAEGMPDQSRHAGKAAYDQKHGRAGLAKPSAGGTSHPEKANGKNRIEPVAKPSFGYTCHPEKANGKNRTEPVANPQGA